MNPLVDTRYQHIFEGMNPSQQEVIATTQGEIVVLAGAGSGKTASLTRRVAYLIAQGIPAHQILCITFTKKAANEMKERISAMVGEQAKKIWMGTFHSVCLRVLQWHKDLLGYENLTIIKDDEQKKIIKSLIEMIDCSQVQEHVEAFIEDAQNKMKLPTDFVPGPDTDMAKVNIYRAYQDHKKEMGYIDYNDILLLTVDLFHRFDNVRERYQKQFQYVMCDEAQDTNDCQFELLSLFSGYYHNLALIGDDFQAIYSFRGSNVRNMMDYSRIENIKLLKLEQNYRSTNTIIQASNGLIEKNKVQLQKESFTQNVQGDYVFVYPADDVSLEADFVAEMTAKMVARENRDYRDIAVLFRNNRQSQQLEMAFRQEKIPYQVINGTSFFDRKEVRDLIGYLRAVDNPIDNLAFERIINVPKRGIGAKAIERINDYAEDSNIPFAKALHYVHEVPKLTKNAIAAIKEFNDIITRLQAYSKEEGALVSKCINMVIDETNFLSQFEVGKNEEEDEKRVNNIKELLTLAREWEQDVSGEESTMPLLTRFLTETSLLSQVDEADMENMVTMMSVHSSKGLEYDVVFVVGMQEESFPSTYARTEAEIEEERRLAYVAMTRAKQRLFLTYSKTRRDYGAGGVAKTVPSRFLNEIPRQYMHVIGLD